MIFGIGVDIVRISRIQKAIDRHGEKFARKILGKNEFQEYKCNNKKVNFLAKRFAAKEAFSKALGTGFTNGLTLKQIEVSHNEIGRPILVLRDHAKNEAEKLNIRHYHVSLSDEHEHVVAFVTLEGRVRHHS